MSYSNKVFLNLANYPIIFQNKPCYSGVFLIPTWIINTIQVRTVNYIMMFTKNV